MDTPHPTKTALVAAMVLLLDERSPEEIRSEDVLKCAGTSKGSLYYHFEDFPALVNEAHVARFSRWVDTSIEILTNVFRSSTTQEELFSGLERVTELTQSPAGQASRFERARILALSESSPLLAKKLGDEQARLTCAIADLVRDAMQLGFYKADLDPESVAVFIQAYSFGKVIDDISTDPVDYAKWTSFISVMLRQTLGAK